MNPFLAKFWRILEHLKRGKLKFIYRFWDQKVSFMHSKTFVNSTFVSFPIVLLFFPKLRPSCGGTISTTLFILLLKHQLFDKALSGQNLQKEGTKGTKWVGWKVISCLKDCLECTQED